MFMLLDVRGSIVPRAPAAPCSMGQGRGSIQALAEPTGARLGEVLEQGTTTLSCVCAPKSR